MHLDEVEYYSDDDYVKHPWKYGGDWYNNKYFPPVKQHVVYYHFPEDNLFYHKQPIRSVHPQKEVPRFSACRPILDYLDSGGSNMSDHFTNTEPVPSYYLGQMPPRFCQFCGRDSEGMLPERDGPDMRTVGCGDFSTVDEEQRERLVKKVRRNKSKNAKRHQSRRVELNKEAMEENEEIDSYVTVASTPKLAKVVSQKEVCDKGVDTSCEEQQQQQLAVVVPAKIERRSLVECFFMMFIRLYARVQKLQWFHYYL